MGGTSRFMKQESAFLHVLCTQESCSSVAGSPTTRPQLLLHLASSCSSCPVPKPVKALYCWEFLVTLISICSFYPPHTSVNSTFAKFSQDPSTVCLLFPAGSLTDMRMTWDEKYKVLLRQEEVPQARFLALDRFAHGLSLPCLWKSNGYRVLASENHLQSLWKMKIQGKTKKLSQIQGD